MTQTLTQGPLFRGEPLVEAANGFGALIDSNDVLEDVDTLRSRMRDDGYLFLPGLLDTSRVQAARDSLLEKMAAEGLLDPGRPRNEGAVLPGRESQFRPDLAQNDAAIDALLYEAEMMDFWRLFLGGPVLHFDYTWLRARSPADVTVTNPHCDKVYMGRGTPDLYTAWTPLDHVPYDFGGLMILEGSSHREDELGDYWRMDVDTYCTNEAEREGLTPDGRRWKEDKGGGFFHTDAFHVQNNLGGRWLGAEYQMGDLLVFGMQTLHAAADNQTDRIRISTDSRYQLASEPADERWMGEAPIGHGPNGQKGMIC